MIEQEVETKKYNWTTWGLLLIVLSLAAWLRWHLLSVPLERDEGEYAYGGQLLLQGIPPYLHLYNMKLPGIYAAYAVVLAIFGQSAWGVHLGLLVVNSLTAIVLFLIGRYLLGNLVGLASAAIFLVLAMGQPVQGIFANAEHFVLLPVLVGVFLFLLAMEREKLWLFFLAGLFLGTGFIIKQHGALFIIWAAGYGFGWWFLKDRRQRRWLFKCSAIALGVSLPYVITCGLLYRAGVFDKFWFWTFQYAWNYAQQVPMAEAWSLFKLRAADIVYASPLLWLSAVLGMGASLWYYRTWRLAGFLMSFAILSGAAVCVGGYFRPHYFILLLPAVSLLAGGFFAVFGSWMGGKHHSLTYWGSLALLVLCLALTLYNQRHFLFTANVEQAIHETYWPNPFAESLPIARYLREHGKPGDRLAVLGSEPQIYFYSGMQSATGYIYMYPLMEGHELALTMQQELIREVEAVRPEYLIFVRIDLSWLTRRESHPLIYEWFGKYSKNYERVGMVEIFNKQSRYSWQPDVIWPPQSPYWIEVMHRKSVNIDDRVKSPDLATPHLRPI